MRTTLLLLVAVMCSGMMCVPATRISYTTKAGLDIRSPKDVSMTNVTAFHSNGVTVISVGSYSSKNNVEVLRAVAEHNQETAEKGAALLGTLLDHAK